MSGHYICDQCGYEGGEHEEGCRNSRPSLRPEQGSNDASETCCATVEERLESLERRVAALEARITPHALFWPVWTKVR
jgi:hypothetical protein